MNVLVTGASGFVGGHLIRAILERGWRVIALDSRRRRHPRGVRSVVADLASLRGIGGLRLDAVVHLAAMSHPASCESDPARAFAVNALGPLRLLRALPRGVRFVHVSSGDVYGRARRIPTPEDESPRPANAYGASKWCAESLLAGQAGRDIVVLRSFNHTGPGQTERFVAPAFASQIARAETGAGPAVVRVGDLRPVRDFLDVRDVVRAYLLALEKAPPGVYNVASGAGTTIRDLLDMLLGLARVPIQVVRDASRLRGGDPDVRIGEASRFRRATGWAPAIPLRKTLADLLDYERAKRESV
ncbi:MAG: GDP-mannose 4,6-dehydratase [Planctomycetes bacterium]|nr:GDP-mannose 4,6-dehydratase [Planctomycetota bacterium]